MKLFVDRFVFAQHGVDDRREFLRDQRARNRFAFAPLPPQEFAFDFGEMLNGANRRRASLGISMFCCGQTRGICVAIAGRSL